MENNHENFDDGRFSLSPRRRPSNPFPVFDKGSLSELDEEFDQIEEDHPRETLRIPLEDKTGKIRLPAMLEGSNAWTTNWTKGEKLGRGAYASVFRVPRSLSEPFLRLSTTTLESCSL